MQWNEGIAEGIARPVALAELGQRYRRYRLADPEAEDAMAIQRFLWPGFKRCTATVTWSSAPRRLRSSALSTGTSEPAGR